MPQTATSRSHRFKIHNESRIRVPQVSPLETWFIDEITMLYAITDRRLYGANEAQACARLLEQAAVWAANGVAFIQMREKDLPARDQVELARSMLHAIRSVKDPATRLLVNSRTDVALAAGADGVHLPAGRDVLTPDEVRSIFIAAGRTTAPILSISCHTLQEVEAAIKFKPDCILFAPVFEKRVAPESGDLPRTMPGTGLDLLHQACQTAGPVPVFALGGVTAENAQDCLRAGAAGIAAIRLLRQPPSIWRPLVESFKNPLR